MKILLLALASTVVACAACSSSADVAGERRNIGNVTVTFTAVPARAKRGQSVRLNIRLLNNGGTPASLTFPTSQRYDFWVTSGSREIWRWSTGQMFTQEVTKQVLDGQTGAAFSESWTATEGGTITVHARLTAEGYDGEMKATVLVQ